MGKIVYGNRNSIIGIIGLTAIICKKLLKLAFLNNITVEFDRIFVIIAAPKNILCA